MQLLKDIRRSYGDFRNSAGGTVLNGPWMKLAGGQRIGHVEKLVVGAETIQVEGWAVADHVGIRTRDGRELASTAPIYSRLDVSRVLGTDREYLGFALAVPNTAEPLQLVLTTEQGEQAYDLPGMTRYNRLRAGLRLNRAYLRMLRKVTPDLIRWLRYRDFTARSRVGALFRGEDHFVPRLNLGLLDGPVLPITQHRDPITIVVPVYGGLDLLDEIIGRVVRHTDLPWHLIAVDDASPQDEVRAVLARWQDRLGPDRMTTLLNAQNLGFVGAANRGLQAAIERGDDVVLLNSDASVCAGWAGRLLAPLRADRGIASVTPMSNDAEIANVPVISRPLELQPGEAELLDQVAAGFANAGALAEAPTGVGFCMAMNIEVLREVPQFDTAFGRGYGEEVDWCQRASQLGRRHILHGGVFVEHRGGASFGSEAKQQLIRDHNAIISGRYPQFDGKVQDFIRNDGLRTQRLALGIALAAQRAAGRGHRLGVYLGHAMGGGAETYLAQRLQREIERSDFAVVIRPQQNGNWQIALHSPVGELVGQIGDASDIPRLFDAVAGLHVVYSCGVGAIDPLAIPEVLLKIAKRPESTVEVTFNDFYPISPSYTLLNSKGVYTGLPLPAEDPAHQALSVRGTIRLPEWQQHWTPLIAAADRLTTFSQSSADIVGSVWPDHRDRIAVRPHQLPVPIGAIPAGPESAGPVIGVLGNISRAKGAGVLADLSEDLARSGKGRLVLIGNLEPGHTLAPPSEPTGSYDLNELAQIVQRHGISRWLFPSVWPETFSYVTHEMLATGLPVWTFDIGAQAEAVRRALSQGHAGGIIPLPKGGYDRRQLHDILTAPLSARDMNKDER